MTPSQTNEPLSELRETLQVLHRHGGEPSTREISRRTGRAISHTTVHVVLRCARTPRWSHLEAVVKALDGDVEEFRELWIAAREADDTAVAGPPPPTASLDDPDPTDATPVNRPSVAAQMSYQLMREILELSEHADGHDLEYIAWRARQLANDLGYLAEHGRPVPRPRPEPERRRTFPLLRRKR